MTQKDESPNASEGPYWSEELLAVLVVGLGDETQARETLEGIIQQAQSGRALQGISEEALASYLSKLYERIAESVQDVDVLVVEEGGEEGREIVVDDGGDITQQARSFAGLPRGASKDVRFINLIWVGMCHPLHRQCQSIQVQSPWSQAYRNCPQAQEGQWQVDQAKVC